MKELPELTDSHVIFARNMLCLQYDVRIHEVGITRSVHDEIVRRFNERIRGGRGSLANRSRIEAFTALVEDSITHRWLTDNRWAGELALMQLRAWLWDAGTALLLRPEEHAQLLEDFASRPSLEGRNRIKALIGSHLVDRFNLRFTDNRSREIAPLTPEGPALVVLSSPMHDVEEGQLQDLIDHVFVAAWLWESQGIATFAPTVLRDPRKNARAANHTGLREVDEVAVSVASVVDLYTYPYSNGVGIISQFAVQHNVPTILTNGRGPSANGLNDPEVPIPVDTTTTTMLRSGKVCDQIIRGNDLELALAECVSLVERNIDRVEDRREHLLRRLQFATEKRDQWLKEVESMSAYEMSSIPDISELITRDDFHRLIAMPLLFVRASGGHQEALELLLPQNCPPLQPEQAQALNLARTDKWTDADTDELERTARRMMARVPTPLDARPRRHSRVPAWWKELYEKTRA
jgi:hypothetical protein